MAELSTPTFGLLNTSDFENTSVGLPLDYSLSPDAEGTETVTPSFWSEARRWLWTTVPVILVVMGTFGNTMSVLVLRRLSSFGQSPLNIYLTSLAVSDTVSLFLINGKICVKIWLNVDIFAYHDWGCKFGVWVLNFSAAISSWLLVAMTIQRAASVVSPHRVNALCTAGRTKVIIGAIVGLMTLAYSHILYGFVAIGNNCGVVSPSYKKFSAEIWAFVDLACFSVFPFALLIVSNGLLVWKLLASISVAKAQLTSSENSAYHVSHRKKTVSSTTLTVVAVSATFFLLTSPLMLFNTVANRNDANGLIADRDKRFFFHSLLFILASGNFSVNFYIYCLTGTKFRACFLEILGCMRHASASTSNAPPSSATTY